MADRLRLTVWRENVHERENALVRQFYPDGMHHGIAAGLREHDESLEGRTATLQEPEHGLTTSVPAETDVLFWLGFAALHSSHYAKIFKRLLGPSCSLTWREAGERERVWVCNPGHPIAREPDRCPNSPLAEAREKLTQRGPQLQRAGEAGFR